MCAILYDILDSEEGYAFCYHLDNTWTLSAERLYSGVIISHV
jgi:hypothetical protein